MNRAIRLFTCLVGLSLLAGCTVTEPVYRPDLGGFAMIDDKETTVVLEHSPKDKPSTKS